jgi:hypothetical protein
MFAIGGNLSGGNARLAKIVAKLRSRIRENSVVNHCSIDDCPTGFSQIPLQKLSESIACRRARRGGDIRQAAV